MSLGSYRARSFILRYNYPIINLVQNDIDLNNELGIQRFLFTLRYPTNVNI